MISDTTGREGLGADQKLASFSNHFRLQSPPIRICTISPGKMETSKEFKVVLLGEGTFIFDSNTERNEKRLRKTAKVPRGSNGNNALKKWW